MNSIIFSSIACQLSVVAFLDLKEKKISNYWSLANLFLALLVYFLWQDQYLWSWEIFIFPLGFIFFGFILFLLNVMGAGDSKYLASLFLVIPVEFHIPFFEKILISTIIVALMNLIIKSIKNFHSLKSFLVSQYWPGIKDIFKSRMSYAPVILLAWFLLGFTLWK